MQWHGLLHDTDILTAFCVENGEIIATGEAILMRANPNWQAIIGNMATLKSRSRSGYGTAILDALIAESCRRWGDVAFGLTNNKNKENFAFYEQYGFVPSDTTVYYLPK